MFHKTFFISGVFKVTGFLIVIIPESW